jgi:polyisoprenoid-binding protein YceI
MFGRPIWRVSLAAVAVTLLWPGSRSSAAEYAIDPASTLVTFEMQSLRAAQRGEFKRAGGTVMLDSTTGSGRIDIVIDARSVQASTAAMTKFVRGPAMLNTGAHPEIAYRSARVVFADGKPSRIEGELTLLGVTRVVPLAVTYYDCTSEQRCSMVATANVKRSAFGMNRYLMFASDEVKLAIQAQSVLIDPMSPG